MAAIFADSPEGLVRTTGLVQPNTDYTISGWFYLSGVPSAGTWRTLFYLHNAGETNYVWIGHDHTTSEIEIDVNGTSFFSDAVTTPGYYYITYRRIVSTTRHELLISGVVEAFRTVDLSAVTFTNVYIGTDTTAGSWDPTKAAYLREWNDNLTDLELEAEMQSPTVVRTSNLWSDAPLFNDLLDDSGNGRDWSASGGTITFESPSNTTAATATDVGTLPASTTGSLAAYEAWFKYTAVSPDQVIGLLASFGTDPPRPFVGVYLGPTGSPTIYLGAQSAGNARVQVPVTVGTTYYFRVQATGLGLLNSFDFNVYRAPNLATPDDGTIVINSDEPGYPAAFVDPETSEILGYRLDVVAGETADILHTTNRILLYRTDGPPHWALYDRNLTLLETITGFSGNIGSGNQVDRFYALTSESGQAWIRSITSDGDLDQRWGPLSYSSPVLVAVNREETIAYITNAALLASDNYIARWSLVSNVALSNLTGTLTYKSNVHRLHSPGVSPGALVTMGDGTIVAAWWSQNQNLSHLRRYAADGTLLDLFDWDDEVDSTAALDRFAHDPDDKTNYFWIWDKKFGLGAFHKFHIPSWSIVQSTPYGAEVFDGGEFALRYDQTDRTLGHPFSCPFFVLGPLSGSGGGGGGSVPEGGVIGPLVWVEWPHTVPDDSGGSPSGGSP